MNKKFSTLMAGFLLTSAFASAQILPNNLEPVTFENDKVTSGEYIILRDLTNDGISNDDLALTATLNGSVLTTKAEALSAAKLADAVWKFTVKEETNAAGTKSYTYTLQNKTTGKYLTFDLNGNLTTNASKAGKAEVGTEYSSIFAAVDGTTAANVEFKNDGNGILYLKGVTVANALALAQTNNVVKVDETGTALILCKYTAEQNADIAKMNDTMGGEGFNLTSAGDKFEGNIFKNGDEYLNLKAFEVVTGTIANVPAGTYFVVVDENMPATLKGKDAQLDKKEEFEAATFVAVDPLKNLNINEVPRGKGKGFWFTTVKGSDFHFNNAAGEVSKKDEIYVGNACFTVINPTLLDETTYQIYTNNARVLKEEGKDDHIAAGKQFIGFVKDQDVDYMITNDEDHALTFKATNETLYDVKGLLNDTDAPAIYTIQFVSGEDKEGVSEYGQWLTVDQHATQTSLRLASVEEINEQDPRFQFVVKKISDYNTDTKKYKKVTFANRQSGVEIELSLFKEGDAYIVYTTDNSNNWDVYPEYIDGNDVNGDVTFGNGVKWATTKIALNPVTVEDKFASFVNREEGAGLVTFALAKNDEAAPEFYVGAKRNAKGLMTGEIFSYSDALDAAQFELEKSEKFLTALNTYMYVKNGRPITSTEKDTVAFYTYKVKAFDADQDNMYLKWGSNDFDLGATGLNFVIKENIDGSVSLIDYNTTNKLEGNSLKVADKLKDGKTAPWATASAYDLTTLLSEGLKTYMVEESPLVSLEAVPQHISFEAVRGGFMTMDENKDARLAIANEASEDLTFWVDTVHSNLNIPSFYITKGGNFLYNAVDSASYYAARKNYRFNLENKATGDAKLIFKAGELVSSDTLRTIVDGKSVLVAEKDNAPKKIKGGLKNFQFQIVRAEEGSDEYVIRKDGQYVCQYNNYFYMKADKSEAYRFVIEKQSAPTANEGIATSEVKVIAGEGNVTIAGAAGKKVVISNILGQVVANTVISSDNATIAAPAGVVVVAVEGEAAVKAIVK